jgi:long-chain acyl-CoA synthetase
MQKVNTEPTNLANLLEKSALRFGRKTAVICEKKRRSYRALNREVNRYANNLKEQFNIQPHDKIGILLNNSLEYILLLFATFKLGATAVPLNTFLTYEEIKFIVKDSRMKVLFAGPKFLTIADKLKSSRSELDNLENIVLVDHRQPGYFTLEAALRSNDCAAPAFVINAEDAALLLYTSGTTGRPKGVMLTHHNILTNLQSCRQALEITFRDRFLLLLPMFHSFTLTVCIYFPIYCGARIIVVPSLKPFRRVIRALLFNRVTILVGIPPLYRIVKQINIPYFLKWLIRLRICISGAAPLDIETLDEFNKKFKFPLIEGYGLTEASPVVSLNPPKGIRKPGSVGLPLPGLEVKVVSPEEAELPEEKVGELIVRGNNVMKGYFNLPEETQKAIRGGWLFTGDMARIDRDGYIFIVDRKKELIISRGMNIYPREIELVLLRHPKVAEAAVIGFDDSRRGEIPVAFVSLMKDIQASERELIDFCKPRLAAYKIPRRIIFKSELPKTPTGKILKRQLKNEYPAG